jgi:hypothetical protein
MRRSTLRLLAVLVLALLGAPLALHVVMHDLHAHESGHADAFSSDSAHVEHEHPIVSSPSPRVPGIWQALRPLIPTPLPEPQMRTRAAKDARNVIAHGAILSTDDDVGLHSLFSTYLI